MPTIEKKTRIEKIALIMSRARDESKVDSEEIIGEAFNKLMDSSEELIDLLVLITEKNENKTSRDI